MFAKGPGTRHNASEKYRRLWKPDLFQGCFWLASVKVDVNQQGGVVIR